MCPFFFVRSPKANGAIEETQEFFLIFNADSAGKKTNFFPHALRGESASRKTDKAFRPDRKLENGFENRLDLRTHRHSR